MHDNVMEVVGINGKGFVGRIKNYLIMHHYNLDTPNFYWRFASSCQVMVAVYLFSKGK